MNALRGPERRRGDRCAARWLAVAVLSVIAASFVAHLRSVIGHDVAHFLALAKIVSGGRTLYDDVIDQNTPAMVGLDLVAIALANATGLAPDRAHTAVVTLVVFAAFALAGSIFRRLTSGDPALRAGFAPCAAVTLFVLPGYDFGTREHVFFACFLPYVVAVVAHQRGTKRSPFESLAVALLAGFGVFMKPHFVVFPTVTAAFELYRSGFALRGLSRETWLLGLTLILAFSAFLLLVPAYLDTVVPLTLATFLHYRIGFWPAIGRNLAPVSLAVGALAVAGLLTRWLPGSRVSSLLPLGWLYLLAGVAIVGVQGFGSPYYALPVRWLADLLGMLVCVWAGSVVLSGSTLAPARARMLVAALSLVMLSAILRSTKDACRIAARSDFENHPFVAVLNDNGPTEYAYVFASSVKPGGWAHVYSDTRWAGHMIPMFLLPIVADRERDPGSHPDATPAALAEVERYERERILEDFQARRPKLVLFDVGSQKRYFETEGFDYLAFLSRDEAFAMIWKELDYQHLGVVADFDGRPFAVYRRRHSDL